MRPSFAHSAEALERAPSLGASLFIVDYQMPAPDGMALLSAIRADARVGQTPVVMVTAAEEREVCYASPTSEKGRHADFPWCGRSTRASSRAGSGNLLALEAARVENVTRLEREQQAARIHARRLALIWKAGASSVDDETFLSDLIDDASRAIVEGRHFAGAISRLDGDEFVNLRFANDVARRGWTR